MGKGKGVGTGAGQRSSPMSYRHNFLVYIELLWFLLMLSIHLQELKQLLDKLDNDGDGRVSFQEFLAELFQHTTPANQGPVVPKPGTPRSVGTIPTRSVSAQKKFKYPPTSGSEERTTPSVVRGRGVTGLVSILDPDKTG